MGFLKWNGLIFRLGVEETVMAEDLEQTAWPELLEDVLMLDYVDLFKDLPKEWNVEETESEVETQSGPQLNAQLEGWLSQVQSTKRPARAIIAPHAGYTYCGSCAAHAYKQVDPTITRKIFILGPSHHVPLSRCALSSVEIYRTPLYDLRIDQKIYGELWKTGMFERMSLQTDEDEHSIEMHLPYTAKAMESHKDEFTIVPVLVGALSESKEQEFGKLFSKYLADPTNLFVVSSDFCHWGQRFRYSYYDESQGEIYRSIEHLDKMADGEGGRREDWSLEVCCKT
ncbi:protein MEMO1 isoform X2 [Gopherus flavomarginatus]|uniref:protein MEMO1 isoform X2 n=1 Tax=Gopherus flavomarginatus TaxID=286002 RepID=UPI0021CC1094|nr:protein MEMO1 isoform X2 [Gopherus flavomarginatus]